MSLYSRRILPWLIKKTCSVPLVRRQRRKVVPLARGRVLEIGAGGGLNLPFLDRAAVSEVLGLDVSQVLLAQAEREAKRIGLRFTPLLLDAAEIPLDADTVDTVLVTFSLCSIDDLDKALSEMHRVLKPDGQLIFSEHGRAPDRGVERVQDIVTPVWKRVSGGCHLNRDPAAEIRKAGFEIEWLDEMYLPRTWRALGWTSWGVARIKP